jgi:hypothetical protein
MNESAPPPDLSDIPAVETLLPRDWWPWWIWAIAAALLLLIGVIVLVASRKPTPAAQRSLAYEEAQRALAQVGIHTTPVALSTALSLILRRYLSVAFHDPSLYETHEEFLARHDALSSLAEETRSLLNAHFNTLRRYKYAPTEGDVDLSLLTPQAADLLHRLHAAPSPP